MGSYWQGHICQCLTRIATFRRNSLVTVAGDRRKTGGQFVDGVFRLARGLRELGICSGHIVAISAYNSDLFLEWLLAVAFVGGIVAPLNYRWSFEEARLAMLVVRPVMLVTDQSCNHWYTEFQSTEILSLRWHVSLSSLSSKFVNMSNVLTTDTLMKYSVSSVPMNYLYAPEGAVIICFTSGTTGRPKGVTISHLALIVQSLAKIAIVGYGENDVYLHTAPMCHIGGLSSAMAMLMVGACHVLIPKFEAKAALEAIEQHQVTSLITVPTMMADLVSLISCQETWKGRDCVRKILNGGGGLSVELIKDANNFFPKAKLLSAYGMTETCSSLTFMTLSDPTLETSDQLIQSFCKSNFNSVQQGVCVGKPAPHIELRIEADSPSQVGRILTRGPHVMLRYWAQIPAQAKDSDNEAWLDTGDIGSIDELGNIWLIGRRNGRIKSGGENVYPEEVEAILSQHQGVNGVVVVGIPDARLTEMVVACILTREDWQWSDKTSEHATKNSVPLLSSETLKYYCKQKNLTGFKIPKIFMLWKKPFPLTTTGKIRRDHVRKEAVSHFHSFHSNL